MATGRNGFVTDSGIEVPAVTAIQMRELKLRPGLLNRDAIQRFQIPLAYRTIETS